MVGLLVAAGIVGAFNVGKAPPSLPSIREELGATLSQAGWILSILNLTTALSGVAIALTADRVGHRRLVLAGTAVCLVASLLGAFAGSIEILLLTRIAEGLGFIAVTVAAPPLLIRLAAPHDHRRVMTLWSSYFPAGAGLMMLIAAVILPITSWRVVWLVAAGASAAMLAVLILTTPSRRELDPLPAERRPILHEMAEVASSGGPLALAICFAAYACCWFAIVGFLPTLQVERLGMATSTAAIVTAGVSIANIAGNQMAGWLLRRGLPRVTLIVGAALSMSFCAAGIFADGMPDLARLVLAAIYSAVIGVIPGALFAALPVHAPRPALIGASTGLMLQGSNIGTLLGPPITGALVTAGGWSSAAWLTSIALGVTAASGIFLHRRERRRL